MILAMAFPLASPFSPKLRLKRIGKLLELLPLLDNLLTRAVERL